MDRESTIYGAIVGVCEAIERGERAVGNGHHLAQQLAGLVDKALTERKEPATTAWRKEPPTSPGFYWLRAYKDAVSRVVKVDGDGDVFYAGVEPCDNVDSTCGEWAPCLAPSTPAPSFPAAVVDAAPRPCWLVWRMDDPAKGVYLVAVDTSPEIAERHKRAFEVEAEMLNRWRRVFIEESRLDHAFGESISKDHPAILATVPGDKGDAT